MSEVPDSVSVSALRKLAEQKGNRLDFSNPVISEDIGDLAFLVNAFIAQKLEGVYMHQEVLFVNFAITRLRKSVDNQLKQAKAQDPVVPRKVEMMSKISAQLLICEGVLDGLLSSVMKQIGSRSTLPSYRLAKSLDPSVRPHEIEDWVKNLGNI